MKKNLLEKISKTFIYTLLMCLFAFIGIITLSGCSSDGNSSSSSTQEPIVFEDDGGLPPDPGQAGMSTLEGIDSDADGVRDDIQRYIAMTYPESEKIRAVLTQYAKAVQNSLLNAGDKELSMQNAEAGTRARSCGYYISGGVLEMRNLTQNMKPIILNTDERTKAYFQYDDQLGGEVFRSIPYDEYSSACDFDPSVMAN